ncbi:VOC family protein [Paractinoplanes atraurantiacus]|nr:VOC family protein [Actinoplanes atraurantiacus]
MLSETLRQATHPLAQFDGLVLDTADPERAAAFWRGALGGRADGLTVRPGPGRPAREILRLRETATPPPDDARVHVDLRLAGAAPDHLTAAGARMIRPPGEDPWYVLEDPDGTQFCAFPAVDDRPAGMFELVVKCSEPHRLARWWAGVLGGRAVDEVEAAAVVGAPEFPWDFMVFDPVPGIERYRSRTRWHLEARDRDMTTLLAAGAVMRAEPSRSEPWWTLADPGGNEFCVVVPGTA